MKSLRRIAAISRVETRRLIQLRIAFTLLFVVPALQVILFGYAIRPDAATVGIAIAAPSANTGALVEKALAGQKGLRVVASNLFPGEAEAWVRRGDALIGLEVPGAAAAAREPIRVIVDAASASLTSVAVARIEATLWRAAARPNAATGRTVPAPQITRLYNPDARADWNFLPCLIGVTTMISMVMLGTLSIAREREAGTWETMLMLPVGPLEVLAGKLLPYTAVGTVQGLIVLAVGILLFDLPTKGNLAALAMMIPLFVATHVVLGYAIAARAATQLAALQGAVAFYLPAMLLSGFLYPFETLPRWAQILGSIFPLTHFVRAAQDVFLRGAGEVAGQAAPILAFFVTCLLLAVAAHTRRIG